MESSDNSQQKKQSQCTTVHILLKRFVKHFCCTCKNLFDKASCVWQNVLTKYVLYSDFDFFLQKNESTLSGYTTQCTDSCLT